MGMTHINLTTLMECNAKACEYYNSLPEHVKEKIKASGNDIDSFDSLKNYVHNLLQNKK